MRPRAILPAAGCGGRACSAQRAGPRTPPRNLAPAETPSRRLPARGGACQLELAQAGRRKAVSLAAGEAARGPARGWKWGLGPFPFGWSGCPPSKFVTPPQSAPVSACNGRGQTDAAPRRAASATRLASAGGCAWGVMMMEWRFLEWSGDFFLNQYHVLVNQYHVRAQAGEIRQPEGGGGGGLGRPKLGHPPYTVGPTACTV